MKIDISLRYVTIGRSLRTPQVLEYAKHSSDRYLSEFKEYLSIPTISTLPEHKPDIERGAKWLSQQLTDAGLQHVQILPTSGNPIVYGDWLGLPGKVTVLIYGHYDVQPADPLDEWISPPFEPVVRGENIFARGASDMKGNGLAILKSLEAWIRNDGLPVNVKVFLEGEEEIGSPSLGQFIETHKDKLGCDLVLNGDSMILKQNMPSLCCGLRGMVYIEVWVYGPEKDLHSGEFGGSVHNPAQVLCELIAGLHDANNRVTLPGFYDQVRLLSKEERAELARIPYSDEEWKQTARVRQLWGEKGFTTLERIGARPTLEVNGLLSGFVGQGSKTVLPAKAMAKISTRLVPNQDPKLVELAFEEYMRKNAPPTVRWEVRRLASTDAVLVNRDTIGMRAASRALEESFGIKPVFRLEGGSVPIVSLLKGKLGVDTVHLGFTLPDDNFHAPNERFWLPNFYRGIEVFVRFFELLSNSSESA